MPAARQLDQVQTYRFCSVWLGVSEYMGRRPGVALVLLRLATALGPGWPPGPLGAVSYLFPIDFLVEINGSGPRAAGGVFLLISY